MEKEKVVEVHNRFVTWSKPLFEAIGANKDFVEMASEGKGIQRKRVFATIKLRKVIHVGMDQITLSVRDPLRKPTIIYKGYTIHDKLLDKFLNT